MFSFLKKQMCFAFVEGDDVQLKTVSVMLILAAYEHHLSFHCSLFRFMYWKTGWKIMRRTCTSHQLEHHTEVSAQFLSQILFLFVWKICFGLDNLLKCQSH